MKSAKKTRESSIEKQALRLIGNPLFLFKAGEKVGELGVVGEERTRLILLLAGVARALPEPPSVMVKGPTSSGKSTVVKSSVRLFPPDCVVERSGLSAKALAHGTGSLARKILFVSEYRGGKDAQLLLRLLQSEGRISHEFTTIRGLQRRTETAERVGMPVVLTTTTEEKVFADDESRFLSLWVDESPEQNLAILIARASGTSVINDRDLPVWQKAMSLLICKKGDFERPPQWLRYVAEQVPLGKVRVRRDWERFLSFCSAIAMCRGRERSDDRLDITFPDYCVAHRILEPVLASTLQGLRTQEFSLCQAVAKLNRRLGRGATVSEISEALGWKESLVYKYMKPAVRHRVVEYELGTRERNVKRVLARDTLTEGFLPRPKLVLKENSEIGKEASFVDPFTGVWQVLRLPNANSDNTQ